jgi:hypothetical protein
MGQMPLGGECKSFIIEEGEGFFESEGCPFLGTIPEICHCYCNVMMSSITKQIDADLEVESTPGTGKDDPRCKWRYYYRTRSPMSKFSNQELDITSMMTHISERELQWRGHHYYGGVWLMITYAMVNGLGSEAMNECLSSRMRRNGFSFGLRIKQYLEIEGRDLDSILRALDVFSKGVCQKNIPLSIDEDTVRIQVNECWWSYNDYATPEHCRLVEIINDSICKSINPDYEFRYDSMRTEGADICAWTVRKRSAIRNYQADAPKAPTEQDLLSVLKMRLARGEISLDQYEKIVQVLK